MYAGMSNKRQKDCLWKQRTHYGLENGSLQALKKTAWILVIQEFTL